jgi:CHAT domain-containing protein/predicted negative regulator of RcsB-dependent stress response
MEMSPKKHQIQFFNKKSRELDFLKTARLLACCLLIFPLTGTVPRSVRKAKASPSQNTKDRSAWKAAFLALLREGSDRFGEANYEAARGRFEEARKMAMAAGDLAQAARAMGNSGGCAFATHQYQLALRTFLEARRIAESVRDASYTAVLDANIASLYGQMGEVEAAVEWLRSSLRTMTGKDRREHLPKLEIEMGSLLARLGRMDEARQMFRQGIDGAERAGNAELRATAWNRLGEDFLRRGQYREAERALLKSYQIRKLYHLPLIYSYCNLGKLRLEEGDLETASALLNQAVELASQPRGPMPEWQLYEARGRVRLAQGRLREALGDLRIALRLGRAWRWSVPADEFARLGTEGVLGTLHAALIEAANRLYLQTREPALAEESFEVAEENRAASLRWLVNGRATAVADPPPAYFEAIARLQRAEVAALRNDDQQTREAAEAARAEVVRMEVSFGPDSQPLPSALLRHVRTALPADTALLSFHLGRSISWLWAIDRDGLEVFPLPPKDAVELQVRTVVEGLRNDRPDLAEASAGLCRTLFGALPEHLRRKNRWLLALDHGLFEAPVPALVETSGARPVYVAERHITEVIPGAGYWLESRGRESALPRAPLFVGVGDPIYNPADERVTRLGVRPEKKTARLDLPVILPRLVASSSELDACARAWSGPSALLKGADASRAKLRDQLQRSPEVVHFATHIVSSPDRRQEGLIALSLTGQNEAEFLSPLEISRWRIHAGVVVLNGCHSAASNRPWSGLMGLTRAWLSAGAESVVVSRWETPDDSGSLFSDFYYNLRARKNQTAVAALRSAQLSMIRSGDWRAHPRYWGAYFVVGSQ